MSESYVIKSQEKKNMCQVDQWRISRFPRPPPAAVDRGERGSAPARSQGISGSHDDEAICGVKRVAIMGLGL